MALDIYVGSFTRYYAGDWENIVQQQARQAGTEVKAVAAIGADEAIRDPEEIRPIVLEWRQGIAAALKEGVKEPFDWDESKDVPYFTNRLGMGALSSLRLWAAYAEHADLQRPSAYVAEPAKDPAYLRSIQPEFESAYSQLVRDVEIWLPWDFPFTFRAPTPSEEKVGLGSAPALLRQLEALNAKTWQATEDTLAQWRKEGADAEASLEAGARHAFAVLHELSRRANEHRSMLRLNY